MPVNNNFDTLSNIYIYHKYSEFILLEVIKVLDLRHKKSESMFPCSCEKDCRKTVSAHPPDSAQVYPAPGRDGTALI